MVRCTQDLEFSAPSLTAALCLCHAKQQDPNQDPHKYLTRFGPLLFFLQTRGNQRELDRARAQARGKGGKKGKDDGLTPQQRKERYVFCAVTVTMPLLLPPLLPVHRPLTHKNTTEMPRHWRRKLQRRKHQRQKDRNRLESHSLSHISCHLTISFYFYRTPQSVKHYYMINTRRKSDN